MKEYAAWIIKRSLDVGDEAGFKVY